MQVMSVTGPVAAEDLGPTLVHEHIIIALPGEELDPRYAPNRELIVQIAVERLKELHGHGIRTLVDPCPIELGRDPQLYAEVSEKSGVQIIFATGFYFEALGIPGYWRARDTEEIAEFYIHELTHGVGKTGLRPGVIKAATGFEVSDNERRILAAAAQAQKAMGCAIITHTEHSRHGDVQQQIFAENGADPGRILIGHQDEQTAWEPIRDLAARGTFVGIDRVGTEALAPDSRRADHAAALVKHGYAGHLCLSQDRVCTLSAARFPFRIPHAAKLDPVQYMQNGRPLSYVFTEFAAMLRERGVSDVDLDTIFRANPRRLLTGMP
ncbi:phosphotriesterase [Novosphingobium bradum]|uniref:Phosphotriesterase n=1 Tax=Novosphingobium bradum TaxID=1737444 RepID=A0ABV7IP07_9SPHN